MRGMSEPREPLDHGTPSSEPRSTFPAWVDWLLVVIAVAFMLLLLAMFVSWFIGQWRLGR
jgi:hypothetical protein